MFPTVSNRYPTTSLTWIAFPLLVFGVSPLATEPNVPHDGHAPQPSPIVRWGDADGDAFPDALSLDASGALSLLQNRGDGTFDDVTSSAGLDALERAAHVLFEDFDGDGLADVFVGPVGGGAFLLTNGGTQFDAETARIVLPVEGTVVGVHSLDYDADGWLDVHVITDVQNVVLHALRDGGFEAIALSAVGHAEDAPGVVPGGVIGPDGTPLDGFGAPGGAASTAAGTATPNPNPAGPTSARGDSLHEPGVPVVDLAPAFGCVASINDVAGGSCLEASSVPMLGKLYPLSDEFFVSTDGKIGFGTTSPTAMLDVVEDGSLGLRITDTVAGQAAQIELVNASNSWKFLSDASPNQMRIEEGGSSRLVIDTGGYVGIGTTTPATRLDVNGSITIRGGADIVESFESSCGELEPGTVVSIDPDRPGMLMCATDPYDTKVAGVVSGAGGVTPGLMLGQDDMFSGDTKVAMTGRVYVKCTVEGGPISPGDRLTTSALDGHAMRVLDGPRADGAVIGKAMSSLDEGTGLVLVLVNLQ